MSGLFRTAATLKNLPGSYALIPEHQHFNLPLRQIFYASHRVIFEIMGNTVYVLRVYHSASRPLRKLNQRATLKKPA